MTREEAIKVFAELNYAYKADEYGDYFYDHGDEVCQAASVAIAALREQEEYEIQRHLKHFDIKAPRPATDTNVGHKWIGVEERLPERGTTVLCYMDFSKSDETKNWQNMITENTYEGVLVGSRPAKHVWEWQGDCVTHWMPLPEPPKEEV